MSDFYRTGMGHKFYEGTMPSLVQQLKRLNDNLESRWPLAEIEALAFNRGLIAAAMEARAAGEDTLSDEILAKQVRVFASPPADEATAGSPAHTSATGESDPLSRR